MTANATLQNWVQQVSQLFSEIETEAQQAGWTPTYGESEVAEDPFHVGGKFLYKIPVLKLKRVNPATQKEESVTFEPRHRFTIGSAGRIDIYSYPALREAMLLRIPKIDPTAELTWEEAEKKVEDTPWLGYTMERLRLEVYSTEMKTIMRLIEDLVS